jgi:hypothetical protein
VPPDLYNQGDGDGARVELFSKGGIAVAVALFRLWASTWRIRITDSARMFFEGRANSQIALLAQSARDGTQPQIRYGQRLRFCGLVSPSRDGAMLSEILKQVGVVPVRGSSTRRAVESHPRANRRHRKTKPPGRHNPRRPAGSGLPAQRRPARAGGTLPHGHPDSIDFRPYRAKKLG